MSFEAKATMEEAVEQEPRQKRDEKASDEVVVDGEKVTGDSNDRRHKFRLDGGVMDHDDMIHVLRQARGASITVQPLPLQKKRFHPTSLLSFDEVSFDADLAAAAMEVFQHPTAPIWDRVDVEFCEGGRHLASVLHVALILNKVRHLFLASDSDSFVDGVFVTACTVLRMQSSLNSLWLLAPLNERVSLAMGECISVNRTLTKLSFSGCNFQSSKAVRSLARGLLKNDAIRTLDISCCGMDDERLQIIILSLMRHPSIETLDLSRNFARTKAMKSLANLLRNPESELHTIDLREQFLEDPSQDSNGKGEVEDENLKVTRLESNEGGEGGHVDEDGDYMTPLAHASSPVPAVGVNRKFLDISDLSLSLQSNERLEALRLAHNHLTDHQVLELAECLKTNVTLSELDLQWNRISDRGVNAFTSTLKDLSGLQVLLLGGNDFGQEGTKILEKLDDDDDSICTVNEQAFKKSHASRSYSLSSSNRRWRS